MRRSQRLHHLLPFEENAEALVHGRPVLGGVDLSLLQRLDAAEVAR